MVFPIDIEYPNGRLETHPLLGDARNLGIILAERDPFHSGRELPRVETLARRHLPQLHRVIGRPRNEESRFR